MAKKNKNSMFDALKEEEKNIAAQQELQPELEADEVRPPAFSKREFSKEELEKLDIFDATIEANQKLVLQNQELQEHCAEYLQTIDDLKKQLAASKNDRQLEQLKNDNDTLLMKISELTFELAKAQSELENTIKEVELQKLQTSVQQNVQTPQSKQVPYQYPRQRTHNGYSDWN